MKTRDKVIARMAGKPCCDGERPAETIEGRQGRPAFRRGRRAVVKSGRKGGF